jgi:hypothetical protein
VAASVDMGQRLRSAEAELAAEAKANAAGFGQIVFRFCSSSQMFLSARLNLRWPKSNF